MSKRKSKCNDETTAYHEAGHAVIARVLGVHVVYATLFSTNRTNNAIVRTEQASWAARKSGDMAALVRAVEADARVTLAGPLAHLKRRPHTNKKRAGRRDWCEDLFKIKLFTAKLAWLQAHGTEPNYDEMLGAVPWAETARIRRRLEAQTKRLVAAHWSAITRTAKALLRRRALHGGEVDALLEGPLPPSWALRPRRRVPPRQRQQGGRDAARAWHPVRRRDRRSACSGR